MTRRAVRAAVVAVLLVPASLVLAGPAVGAPEGEAAAITPAVRPVVSLLGPDHASRWAHPTRRAMVRDKPDAKSRRIGQLRLLTEDDFPEVYLLLASYQDATTQQWVRVRLPGRPNGRTGWVPQDALGGFRVVYTALHVNRAQRRVTLRTRGKVTASYRIGVGAKATPTPAGFFWIREKFHANGGIYGPRAMGTAAYAPGLTDWPGGGVIGFHGTNQPGLIPGNPSHGCIRLRNADILKLYRRVPVGTPVRIV